MEQRADGVWIGEGRDFAALLGLTAKEAIERMEADGIELRPTNGGANFGVSGLHLEPRWRVYLEERRAEMRQELNGEAPEQGGWQMGMEPPARPVAEPVYEGAYPEPDYEGREPEASEEPGRLWFKPESGSCWVDENGLRWPLTVEPGSEVQS